MLSVVSFSIISGKDDFYKYKIFCIFEFIQILHLFISYRI